MIYQVQVPIGSLPVHLVLVGNKDHAGVVFVQAMSVTEEIFDCDGNGWIRAVFFKDDFCLVNGQDDEYFKYNTVYNYKEIPAMLEWLKAQKLEQPE